MLSPSGVHFALFMVVCVFCCQHFLFGSCFLNQPSSFAYPSFDDYFERNVWNLVLEMFLDTGMVLPNPTSRPGSRLCPMIHWAPLSIEFLLCHLCDIHMRQKAGFRIRLHAERSLNAAGNVPKLIFALHCCLVWLL